MGKFISNVETYEIDIDCFANLKHAYCFGMQEIQYRIILNYRYFLYFHFYQVHSMAHIPASPMLL